MRNYYFETADDKKTLIIGTGWDSKTQKLNQIGTITKNGSVWIDFNFKLPNGQTINKKRIYMESALETIADYLSKEDLISLCGILYLWGGVN